MKFKKIFIIFAILLFLSAIVYANNEMVKTEYCKKHLLTRTNTSYVIETNNSISRTVYNKSYIKGNKWKTMTSYNGGKSYENVTLYNGNNVYEYNIGDNEVKLLTVYDDMKNDPAFRKTMIEACNIIDPLLNWQKPILLWGDATSAYFANKNDNRNGFDCTLIKFENSSQEFCVSEKLGIAVYNRALEGNVMNVVKVETKSIADSEFELPKGMKVKRW